MSNRFLPATSKLSIGSLEPGHNGTKVTAQYNPKELQIDQAVPWSKKNAANQSGGEAGASSDGGIELEFTGAEGRSMSVELLFDGVEPENGRAVNVAGCIATLQQLASVMEPASIDENKRRPHRCVVEWGAAVPRFECVIESFSTKYTMFSKEGAPLRATCTVRLKEATRVSAKSSRGG